MFPTPIACRVRPDGNAGAVTIFSDLMQSLSHHRRESFANVPAEPQFGAILQSKGRVARAERRDVLDAIERHDRAAVNASSKRARVDLFRLRQSDTVGGAARGNFFRK